MVSIYQLFKVNLKVTQIPAQNASHKLVFRSMNNEYINFTTTNNTFNKMEIFGIIFQNIHKSCCAFECEVDLHKPQNRHIQNMRYAVHNWHSTTKNNIFSNGICYELVKPNT